MDRRDKLVRSVSGSFDPGEVEPVLRSRVGAFASPPDISFILVWAGRGGCPAAGRGLRQRGNDFQDLLPRHAQQFHHRSKGVFALLVKGPQHTHQNLLYLGALPGAVATPHLPRHHRRPNRPLRPIGGPFQTGAMQKGEQVLPLLAQMVGQPFIAGVAVVLLQQPMADSSRPVATARP